MFHYNKLYYRSHFGSSSSCASSVPAPATMASQASPASATLAAASSPPWESWGPAQALPHSYKNTFQTKAVILIYNVIATFFKDFHKNHLKNPGEGTYDLVMNDPKTIYNAKSFRYYSGLLHSAMKSLCAFMIKQKSEVDSDTRYWLYIDLTYGWPESKKQDKNFMSLRSELIVALGIVEV